MELDTVFLCSLLWFFLGLLCFALPYAAAITKLRRKWNNCDYFWLAIFLGPVMWGFVCFMVLGALFDQHQDTIYKYCMIPYIKFAKFVSKCPSSKKKR
jgi:hypothetical protein